MAKATRTVQTITGSANEPLRGERISRRDGSGDPQCSQPTSHRDPHFCSVGPAYNGLHLLRL